MRKHIRTSEPKAGRPARRAAERGSATLTAVLIMGLLFVFAALALSRTTTEALIMGNDSATTRSFYAAQASLEVMTRNFNKIFDVQINPSQADLDNMQNNASAQNAGWMPLFPGYVFNQQIIPANVAGITTQNVTLSGGPYEGLRAARSTWQFVTTATGPTGAQVQLTRSFFSNRLPIFQFGVFYENDMDFWPGPEMFMGGRVHTNGNLFLCGNSGLHFRSKVTAVGEVVVDKARNGGDMYYIDNVWVTDGGAGNSEQRVTEGSVINGPNVGGNQPGHLAGTLNANWTNFSARFNDNLIARAPRLRMPLQLSGSDPVELIRRAPAGNENVLVAASRYYNKASIRITLDDRQTRLPNCAGAPVGCGRRLDGASDGLGGDQDADGSRGYLPRSMLGAAYQAARVNGHRLYTGANYAGGTPNRQTWIKVELVTPNPADPDSPVVADITEDFLSLGLTEPEVFTNAAGANVQAGDTRSIVRIQRYRIDGPPVKVNDIHDTVLNVAAPTTLPHQGAGGGNRPSSTYVAAPGYTVVTSANAYIANAETFHLFPAGAATVRINAANVDLLPFPITMFDTREGLYNDDLTNADWNTLYLPGGVGSNDNLPWRGVMSVVDIDMANFRLFMQGAFNGMFRNGLTSAAVPLDPQGVILYVSDRRGDADGDGVYDMENVYVPAANDNAVGAGAGLQAGEDLGGGGNGGMFPDGLLQADYVWESTPYSSAVPSDLAALSEQPWPAAVAGMPAGYNLGHRFYRRAVRLVNGSQLPGSLTQGVTVATENATYVLGNYNATGVVAPIGVEPTPPGGFLPVNTWVPASIAADAITILSNSWNDGKSFRNPFRLNSGTALGIANSRQATETTVRAALLMGTTKSSLLTNPNQGGGAGPNGGTLQNSDGGVNNFPRLIEDWGTGGPVRLNYLGSMISLFYSRNANGSYKGHNGPGTSVITFLAPNRNWNFDTNFLVPTQNPPGTPFLQYVQVTGFRQTNN